MTMKRASVWSAIALAMATPVLAGQSVPSVPSVPALPVMPAVPTSPMMPMVPVPPIPPMPVLPTLPEMRLPSPAALARALAAADWARANVGIGFDDRDFERQDRAREEQDREREKADREREKLERDREREQNAREREQDRYDDGQEYLDEGKWEQAASRFAQVAALKGSRADAALYWQAYALNRQGQRAESIQVIAELTKAYPSSRYLAQAKALDSEVRRMAGQPVRPEAEADEDLKLMAIQALQNSDPASAIPMLENLLKGTASPKLKSRALFVLAQSNSPRARQVLADVARGASLPDLQERAIQYLGIHGGAENRALLAEIYAASNDVDIKRRVLRSFMVSGDRKRVFDLATSEKDPALRAEAVRQLGVMGAHAELSQLYQKETSLDVKKQILQAMFVGGDSTRLIELARNEQNPELRRIAVRNLGLMGASRSGTALVEIYNSDKDPAIKSAVIEALFISNNAESLVALARKETDANMKREMVRKLSLMQSKVALDYLMELLK
jgi:HEAT repeat protein